MLKYHDNVTVWFATVIKGNKLHFLCTKSLCGCVKFKTTKALCNCWLYVDAYSKLTQNILKPWSTTLLIEPNLIVVMIKLMYHKHICIFQTWCTSQFQLDNILTMQFINLHAIVLIHIHALFVLCCTDFKDKGFKGSKIWLLNYPS